MPHSEEPRVLLEVRDEIAYVTLNRADKLNGFDLDMLDALVATARRVKRDKAVRAVILQADGAAFTAGLDFGSVLKQPWRIARGFLTVPPRSVNLFQNACWAWRTLPVPVIAVVHGRCYGAGVQLALAADFRFATPDSEWAVLEAKWGLVPDMSGTVTLRELVGADVAKRLTMTGESFDGERAKAYGLVTEVSQTPLAGAEAFAELLKTRSPDSVSASKALLNRTRHLSPRAAFRIERALQLRMLFSKNSKIARTAGFKGGAPEFEPRSFGG